jgi:hypothetical protein
MKCIVPGMKITDLLICTLILPARVINNRSCEDDEYSVIFRRK